MATTRQQPREKWLKDLTSKKHMCNGLNMASPIFFHTGTLFSTDNARPLFFALRYRIRLLDVSCMNKIATATGAQIMRITHIAYFQLLSYWAMMYAPTRGPRVGPRKGAIIYVNPTRPAFRGFHRSATVPRNQSAMRWLQGN